MTTLILIRHGESAANRNEIFAGQIDPELQDKGLKQAKITAKYIADNYKVDKIYSSDLKRAKNTAMCLAEMLNLEVITDKNLREIDAGEWEGIRFGDLGRLYHEEYSIWMNDIGNGYCNGGETVKQLAERVMNTLGRIADENDGKVVAVATHATPIRVAQSIIETGALEKMKNIPCVANASVSIFECESGIWKINKVSVDEHLAELKTVLPTSV